MPIPISENWRNNILWRDAPRRDDFNDRMDALENRIERYGIPACDQMFDEPREVHDGQPAYKNPAGKRPGR